MLKYQLRKHQIKHGKVKARRGEMLYLRFCEWCHLWWEGLTKGEWLILTGSILFLLAALNAVVDDDDFIVISRHMLGFCLSILALILIARAKRKK
jgi:hypothetical protein